MIGTKVGRWKVLSIFRRSVAVGRSRSTPFAHCICECGKTKDVRVSNLKMGISLSCGCYQKERSAETQIKHGALVRKDDIPKEYLVWQAMLNRCRNPRFIGYANYGGRGITVCKRWEDFRNFIADMGFRPSPEFTVERINNDGNYEPSNCKWATRKEQRNNQRPHKRNRIGPYKQNGGFFSRQQSY